MRTLREPRSIISILVALAVMLTVVGCQGGGHGAGAKVVADQPTLRVSVQPVFSLQVTTERYLPLIEYLGRETGYKMRVVSALSYNGYLTTLEGDQVDIGFQGPTAYVIAAKARGAKPLAQAVTIDGKKGYRGVIIVHQDSPIKSIPDLRGKTGMIVSHRSLGGYLAQRALCLDNGLDVASEMVIGVAPTEDVIIHSVHDKRVDAGFVREDALQAVSARLDLSKIRVLATTDSYPGWVFASFQDTDPIAAAEVKAALLRLRPDIAEERAMLEAAQLAGFVEVDDKDYDSVRKLMNRLGVPF